MVIFGIICFIVLTYAISAPSFGGGNCYVAREIKNSKKEELQDDRVLSEIVELLKNNKNIFITGGAGTGKSYLLKN